MGRIASTHYRPANDQLPGILWEYVADIQVNHGNSGGPVFSAGTRSVIGLCQAYQNAPVSADGQGPTFGFRPVPGANPEAVPLVGNSGLAVIVPTEYIVDILRANGIKFGGRTGPGSADKAQGPPGMRVVPVRPSIRQQ